MARALVYFVLVAVVSSPMFGQSAAKPLAFEIADIHPSPPGTSLQSLILRGPFVAGRAVRVTKRDAFGHDPDCL